MSSILIYVVAFRFTYCHGTRAFQKLYLYLVDVLVLNPEKGITKLALRYLIHAIEIITAILITCV